MIRNCKVCDKEFRTYPSKVKIGRGKYCSKECSNYVTLIKKGERRSPKTEIKKSKPLPEHIYKGQLRSWDKRSKTKNRKGKKSSNLPRVPHNYKGYFYNDAGYKLIHKPEHPNADKDGCVREHRLIVEKEIGRYLHRYEIVHHVNEIRDDNRPENLWVFKDFRSHLRHHRGLEYPEDDVVFKGGDVRCP